MSPITRYLAALGLAFLAVSGPATAEEPNAFERVIAAQIEAFARDDGPAAFAFASPGIQESFGTPERFMAMVRAGFAPVYRPRAYSFEEPVFVDGAHAQPVRVIGPDGRAVIALYRMEHQPDGSWRIAGVTLHPIAERGI